MSNESLRLLARQAIWNGRIPNSHPERIWGGPGNADPCAICNGPVGELGLDLEFVRDDGAVEYSVHIDCFAAWKLECGLSDEPTHSSAQNPRLASRGS